MNNTDIITKLRIAMTDARQNESHFESWMILNEAICDAIDALAEQPAPSQYGSPELQAMIVARALEKDAAEQPAPVQQEPISLAGEGHELYQQLLEAGRELLRAVNEDEKWGCVGPGPTEIAWDKFSSLASHVCTGIDSPQPVQQEPVAEVVMAAKPPKASPAWLPFKIVHAPLEWLDSAPVGTKLYTSPPAQRTWVGLSDEKIARVVSLAGFAPDWVEAHIAIQIVRVLEAELKEMNT